MIYDKSKMIKLIVLDVDGTMTDGGIYYDAEGNEEKKFNVKDGIGIKAAIMDGLQVAIITGRKSKIVNKRAKELDISYVLDGAQNKFPVFQELLQKLGLSSSEVFYIGDDVNDLQCMKWAGMCACPHDADKSVQAISDFVSSVSGGQGAVRECIEELLTVRMEWDNCIQLLYSES